METVDVKQAAENNLLLEWKAGAMNDAIADSVLALTLSIETSPVSVNNGASIERLLSPMSRRRN